MEHILVCLSSAPSNEKIIRTAARMAEAYHSQFTAIFVETPDFSVATQENKQRLQRNRSLAKKLGAKIETIYGEDVPYQIAEFSRLAGVTQIVLGSSTVTRKHIWGKLTIAEQLIMYAPEVDIHIIPDQNTKKVYRPKRKEDSKKNIIYNVLKCLMILVGATLFGNLFYHLGFTNANIIMVYILGVLLISVVITNRMYSLISSIASVFIFNFFFTTPRFSLTAYETGYPVTFVVMFLTAFITATFAGQYKEQARQSAKIAYRTRVLFETNRMIAKAKSKPEIIDTTAKQLVKLLGRNIVVFDGTDENFQNPLFYFEKENGYLYQLEEEIHVVKWVIANNHSAGAGTEMWPEKNYLYLALRVNERVYGVVGIEASDSPLDASENDILLSILGECALALENEKNAREKEIAAILAESEQLRANLLRTISHDLRTPLTSISGNASNLLNNSQSFDAETKQQIYKDIYEESIWLINLVENLLAATKIEEGKMILSTSTEILHDIIEEAVRHTKHAAERHKLKIEYTDEMLPVRADARLVVQVIVNLIDNAVKYTQEGTEIEVIAEQKDGMAWVSVRDYGTGIVDEEKKKVFDKFYCGSNKIADNRRSLGLGLFLCKAIVEAHGGVMEVRDHTPTGTVFSFSLPLSEVILHE